MNQIRVIQTNDTGDLIAIAPPGKCFKANGGHRLLISPNHSEADKADKLAALQKALPPEPFNDCDCIQCHKRRKMALSGPGLRKLMRRHKVSIVELADRMRVTMKQIRLRRLMGCEQAAIARDYVQAITKIDPGEKLCYEPI